MFAHSAQKEMGNRFQEKGRTVSSSKRDLAKDKEAATSHGVRIFLSGSPTLVSMHQFTTAYLAAKCHFFWIRLMSNILYRRATHLATVAAFSEPFQTRER